MARREDFEPAVALPSGLTLQAVQRTIAYVERETSEFVEVYLEQANIFSALVGIFATKGLDQVSVYEKHRHPDIAQQRFPDLRKRGSGLNPTPLESLEVKASKRPWAIQSHYDHTGWYVDFRYLVDPTHTLAEQPVVIWRVDVAFLTQADWKYEGSRAGADGGGRTHTFGVREPAKRLEGCAFYRRSDVVLRQGKPVPSAVD
jgi:hypothetical protein